MKINSSKALLPYSSSQLFSFLQTASSFELLMPDNCQKFELLSEDKGFSFILSGMPEIAIKIMEITSSQIIMKSAKQSVDFTLIINIVEVKEKQETELVFDFEGNFNPMMAMMVKKPLNSFLETMIAKIEQVQL